MMLKVAFAVYYLRVMQLQYSILRINDTYAAQFEPE
jgi:hypothetical protein